MTEWNYAITHKGRKALDTPDTVYGLSKQTLYHLTQDDDLNNTEIQALLDIDYVHVRDILIILESKGYIKNMTLEQETKWGKKRA